MDFEVVTACRLILASILGGLIGFEREIHGRPAGFRTHLLVSLGSCLFVTSSIHFYDQFGNFSGTAPVGVDPARVAAQVVAGIGFLGAGAIIREKASIRGLTTAACLWVAAAIGLACGIGLYVTAIEVTIFALLSLLLLKKVEARLHKDSYFTFKIWCHDNDGQMSRIESLIKECEMHVVNISIEKDKEQNQIVFEYDVKHSKGTAASCLIEKNFGSRWYKAGAIELAGK